MTFGRDSIEPGLEQSLIERNRVLKDIFDTKVIQAKVKVKGADKEGADEDGYKYIERPVVRFYFFYIFQLLKFIDDCSAAETENSDTETRTGIGWNGPESETKDQDWPRFRDLDWPGTAQGEASRTAGNCPTPPPPSQGVGGSLPRVQVKMVKFLVKKAIFARFHPKVGLECKHLTPPPSI